MIVDVLHSHLPSVHLFLAENEIEKVDYKDYEN